MTVVDVNNVAYFLLFSSSLEWPLFLFPSLFISADLSEYISCIEILVPHCRVVVVLPTIPPSHFKTSVMLFLQNALKEIQHALLLTWLLIWASSQPWPLVPMRWIILWSGLCTGLHKAPCSGLFLSSVMTVDIKASARTKL